MAGRNRVSRNNEPRGFRHGPRPVMIQGPGPMHLEDEVEMRREDIRRLRIENQRLVDDQMMIRAKLTTARADSQRMGQTILQLRAEGDARRREVIQKSVQLESELRAAEPLKADVAHLRAEAQKLNVLKEELSTKVEGLTQELTRMKAESKQILTMRSDMDRLQQELIRVREIFDHEKKANLEQKEHKQAMEMSLHEMAREIEKLRAKSSRESTRGLGAAYGGLKASSDVGYGGSAFGESYGGAWGSYDIHGP